MAGLSARSPTPFSAGSYLELVITRNRLGFLFAGLRRLRLLVGRLWRVVLRDGGAGERLAVDVARVVAGGDVAVPVVRERRLDLLADVRRVPAARMEAASRGRVDRARDVAHEDDALPLLAQVRVGDRHRGKQRLRVRHDRALVELLRRRELDELA